MGKIENNKKKKRMDILNAAYELFTTIGYDKTTILGIALRAGVGKGTFYLYFKSKEDVRDELIMIKSSKLLKEATDSFTSYSAAAADPLNVADGFIYIADYILTSLSKDITLLKFVSKNLTWGLLLQSDKYRSIDDEVLDFPTFVNEGLQREKQQLRNPELLFYTLIELTNATCYNIILHSDPVPFEEYKPYLYNCIRRIVEDAIIA